MSSGLLSMIRVPGTRRWRSSRRLASGRWRASTRGHQSVQGLVFQSSATQSCSRSTRTCRSACNVDEPAKVGIDRLLRRGRGKAKVPPGTPAITVDVGTAVTVDLIDAEGVFQGGAIFPGPRLMARSLHEYTARLPLIDLIEHAIRRLPGQEHSRSDSTSEYDSALLGGVGTLLSLVSDRCSSPPWLFITGGGLGILDGCGFPRGRGVANHPHPHPRRHPHRRGGAAVSCEPTRVAVLTPPGTGAIATVEVSGPQAWEHRSTTLSPRRQASARIARAASLLVRHARGGRG